MPLINPFTTNVDVLQLRGFTTSEIPAASADNEGSLFYDTTLNQLKVSNGSALSGASFTKNVESIVAVVANVGTLASIPILVQNVFATAGGVTGDKVIVPSSQAPGAGEVSINMTTGVMTFNAGDAVTSVTVTFIS